jgi:dUTPase
LANCEGVIDAGYRGNIKAPVDWSMFYSKPKGKSSMESLFTMQKHARYFQLCMPTLTPFQVYIVDKLDDTKRGEGGFGSTGK